jgi:hypothetical protein
MALTVAELIELLQAQPQDAPVEVEGCDCVGPAGSVDGPDTVHGSPTVVINRWYGDRL